MERSKVRSTAGKASKAEAVSLGAPKGKNTHLLVFSKGEVCFCAPGGQPEHFAIADPEAHARDCERIGRQWLQVAACVRAANRQSTGRARRR